MALAHAATLARILTVIAPTGVEGMCNLQGVLADVSIATGYVTIALMMGGKMVFQHLGWATAAFITPSVLMLFGGAFFAFSLSGSASTASWAVFAGAITQVGCQPLLHGLCMHEE